MPTYTPVTVVPSGGAPFVQVSGNGPPMTVVPNAVPITLVTANAPPVVLYNPDGSPYSTDPFPQTSAILGAGGLDYAFYDSRLASSLFQDAAGTTPALLTNPVGRWNVRQRPPHFASQTVSNQRPSLQADGVKFDGVAQNLLTDWFAQAGSNCIIAQVTVPAVLGSDQNFVGGTEGAANRFFLTALAGGRIGAGIGSQNQTVIQSGPIDVRGREIICGVCCDGSNVSLFVDGAQEYFAPQSGAPTVARASALGAVNNNAGASNFFGGSIRRAAFAKTALTLEQFQSIRTEWLAAA